MGRSRHPLLENGLPRTRAMLCGGLFVAFAAVAWAQDADCYSRCIQQGRTSQLCASMCGSGQRSQSIRVNPTPGLLPPAPQGSATSPEVLRAQCVVQKDILACKKLQELQGTAPSQEAGGSNPPALAPARAQQFNQRLQQKNIPEDLRLKCVIEFNLQVCAEIDEMLAGKRPIP